LCVSLALVCALPTTWLRYAYSHFIDRERERERETEKLAITKLAQTEVNSVTLPSDDAAAASADN